MIKNIKIKSNICLFWCGLDEKTETEQHLTISNTGRVWFKAVGEKGVLRKTTLSIGKENAKNLLEKTDKFIEHYLDYAIADDAGVWSMTITYPGGTKKKFSGSMVCDYSRLCEEIRACVAIDDLWVFVSE